MRVAELNGALLALWVARIDPRCKDLRWETQGNDWVGYASTGGSPEFPCLFISAAPGVVAQIKLASKLRAEAYAPHKNWAHGGSLIDAKRIGIEFSYGDWSGRVADDEDWVKLIHQHPQMEGDTALVAAMRALVASVYGSSVPDEEPA